MSDHPTVIELAVIGAGPCGLGVGTSARTEEVECVIFDKASITSSIARYPTYITFFSTAERLEIGGIPFIPVGDKPTRREALKYYRRVAEEYDLHIHQFEEVVEIRHSTGPGRFTLRTMSKDGRAAQYAAQNVAIATGYFDSPNMLGVPGENLPKVLHEYREGHTFFEQDCLIVGGGNSAVEAALELYRSGARVTIVHFLEQLDARIKPWILPDMSGRIREGEIKSYFRHRLVDIKPSTVVLRDEETGASTILQNDWVLAMTGYTPNPRLLTTLGVEIDPETGIPQHNTETMETNVPGVFVVGVISAGYQANHIFIENGREHGPKIVQRILNARLD